MSEINQIVGIDNGIDGGIAVIAAHDGVVITTTAMPTKQLNSKTVPDLVAVIAMLRDYDPARTIVAIEEPLKHAKSSQAMRSMSMCFGMLYGALSSRYDVATIDPRVWQKKMLMFALGATTKQKALYEAQRRWPDETWLASSRCKVPHDGIVDAALIAEYARIIAF